MNNGTLNGTPRLTVPPPTPRGKAKGTGTAPTTPPTKGKRTKGQGKALSLSYRRKAALVTGSVAVGLLVLSVSHLTEAIGSLTGSHWFLSMLLAMGIDAGMLCAEGACLLSEDNEVRAWAGGYVITTVLASMALNAYAFSSHAPVGMEWAAMGLGVLIPGLILALGKFGGKLWLRG